ncbi:MAG: hypothetical protein MUO39_03805 [Steroidobacteraceae bacterium]|nr:hypothetical protein [Steroidobacteraceae bacterium]
MAGKPGDKTTPTIPDEASTGPGHLGTDDRGNVTWEWADKAELQADDTLGGAERVRALVDPRLDVLEEDASADNPTAVNPKRLKTGYNPYNSGALGKQTWKKKKNLQELSKWIELRKKMADKKGDE